ncbi:MAG TPA: hypothetical protein VNI84_05890 [Pyrinomonadaceae bacterium]|nr:hypothetical protein [Pyrinomonadaceae bacterium]
MEISTTKYKKRTGRTVGARASCPPLERKSANKSTLSSVAF